MNPLVVYRWTGRAEGPNDVTSVEAKKETRGVKIRVPGAPAQVTVTVSAEREDEGPWGEPVVTLPQARIEYAQWNDLQRAVEKGFAEYAVRYDALAEPPREAARTPKKRQRHEPEPPCTCVSPAIVDPFCPLHMGFPR